jgi:hypothetical protein
MITPISTGSISVDSLIPLVHCSPILALDEPIIEELTYREAGTSLNGKKTTSGRGRTSTKPMDEAPELYRAVEVALAKRKVRALFFDEAQHLMANGETENLKRRWDWLKSLSNTK